MSSPDIVQLPDDTGKSVPDNAKPTRFTYATLVDFIEDHFDGATIEGEGLKRVRLVARVTQYKTRAEQHAALTDAIQRELISQSAKEPSAAQKGIDDIFRDVRYQYFDGEPQPWFTENRPSWAKAGEDDLGVDEEYLNPPTLGRWRSSVTHVPMKTCRAKRKSDGRIDLSTLALVLEQRVADRLPFLRMETIEYDVHGVKRNGDRIELELDEAAVLARALLLYIDLANEGGVANV